uniref:Ground-like domain-containing protein n=1 Tax=Parascaris univalens TaxID=6257 RepID=A0A915B6F4_PARUN
ILAEQERLRTDVTFNKKKVKVATDQERIAQLNKDITDGVQKPPPDCFINERGFLCCNRDLLKLIDDANRYVIARNYSQCNKQIFAQILHKKAEKKFGITFEIIVSTSDFASKSHFRENFICKDRINRRFILIYATPVSYVIGEKNKPRSVISTLDE